MRTLTLAMALTFGAVALAGCGPSAPSISNDDPKVKALVAELGPDYASADVVKGRGTFELCRSCHTVVQDGPNMTGPNLYGVFGRQAASKAGYFYSGALRAADITWNAAALDKWIADPRADVSGTKMSFPGLKSEADRKNVIAYLKVASSGGPN